MSIKSLNEHDVILGRGSGPSCFIGNTKFHEHVDARRKEYVSTKSNQDKARIAREVVCLVHSLGGRFVRQVKKGRKEGGLLVGGLWQEVPRSVAVEKAKQALREKHPKDRKVDESMTQVEKESTSGSTVLIEEGVNELSAPPSLTNGFDTVGPLLGLSYSPSQVVPFFLPNSQQAPNAVSICDSGLLFTSSSGLVPLPAQPLLGTMSTFFGQTGGGRLPLIPYSYASFNSLQSEDIPSLQQDSHNHSLIIPSESISCATGKRRIGNEIDAPSSEPTVNTTEPRPTETSASLKTGPSSDRTKDEDVAAYVLATLALKDRPMVTNDEIELELAALPNEQRASALADLFGKMNVDSGSPQSKKAKKDLDRESIDFLIGQMRLAIDMVPDEDKEALLEAQAKCRPEEFSDSRLEKFLRVEGMNAELAAVRFVGYWEKRKETFGPHKFTMRLTLSEALKDDICALQSGVYHLLPHKDSSGRQLLLVTPHKNTGEAYTSDSLLRAFWYICEVAASQNSDARCGVVDVVWLKGFTIFDYDPMIFDTAITHYHNFFPVKPVAVHLCCPTGVIARVFIPVVNGFIDSWSRSRTRLHNVPAGEIVPTLEEYGIQKQVLPTEIGGNLELNAPAKWTAERRAAEMELEELS